MSKPNILIFAGSCRRESLNAKLARAAADLAASKANITLIDLADYPAPIYNGDDEAASGMPDSMREFRQLARASDGFIIVTPEYNGHVPPLLVNTLAWGSRTAGDPIDDNVFSGKRAAIMAASPGRLGGIRVIPRLREMLAELRIVVAPGFATVPAAHNAFDEGGKLNDSGTIKQVDELIDRLIACC